ncbi:MAG TPA: phytanoyl-CoA dioxygenase family protein [Chloroflexota bacterium]|nr:phytanoyl-CoA dioxygenase family protein [Chloroflexota bacterium]
MYLSDQKRAFFQTFGFLAFPGLFVDKIAAITEAFEDIWQRHGGGHAGKAHEGVARSALAQFIDQDERLCALLDDPRILEIAGGLLGDDFNYRGSDGNFYVGDTRWHSDGWRTNGMRHIKMAFYLDPVDANSGCLRVIPGSCYTEDHFAQALQAQVRQSQELWGIEGRDVPAVPLETQPGDLILFDHNTKHAAFGGGARRRMFTMNLSQRYPAELLPELRETIGGASRFWVERVYGETMIRTAGPERMRHLEQVMANDGHLAELSRKAREKMAEPARG